MKRRSVGRAVSTHTPHPHHSTHSDTPSCHQQQHSVENRNKKQQQLIHGNYNFFSPQQAGMIILTSDVLYGKRASLTEIPIGMLAVIVFLCLLNVLFNLLCYSLATHNTCTHIYT